MQLVVLVAAAVPATIELLEPINKALVQREATDRANAFFHADWEGGSETVHTQVGQTAVYFRSVHRSVSSASWNHALGLCVSGSTQSSCPTVLQMTA